MIILKIIYDISGYQIDEFSNFLLLLEKNYRK